MNFDVFTLIYSILVSPLLAGVTAMNETLSGAVAPVLRVAIIALLAWTCLVAMFRQRGEPLLGTYIGTALLGAIALWMVTSSAGYGTVARDVLLLGLPRELPQLIAGVIPGSGQAITASAFMSIWRRAWAAGLLIINNLPWAMAAIPLAACAVIFWIVAAVAIARAFLVWLKATVILAVLIGIGPLFAALWLFPWTRGWFMGWLNTVMANIVLMVLVVALLTLVLVTTERLLIDIAAGVRTTGNEANQAGSLAVGGILFYFLFDIAKSLPGYANSIAHGFAGYARSGGMRLMAAVQAVRARGGGSSASTPAGTATGGGPTPAPVRAAAPPGPSLSNTW